MYEGSTWHINITGSFCYPRNDSHWPIQLHVYQEMVLVSSAVHCGRIYDAVVYLLVWIGFSIWLSYWSGGFDRLHPSSLIPKKCLLVFPQNRKFNSLFAYRVFTWKHDAIGLLRLDYDILCLKYSSIVQNRWCEYVQIKSNMATGQWVRFVSIQKLLDAVSGMWIMLELGTYLVSNHFFIYVHCLCLSRVQ